MSTTPTIESPVSEHIRSRRLIIVVVSLSIVFVVSPYLVRILFGTEAANFIAALGLPLLVMAVLTIRPDRVHLSTKTLSRVYVWALLAFIFYLVSTVLYLWFYGAGAT